MAHARKSSSAAIVATDVKAPNVALESQAAFPRPADTLDSAYLVSPARAQQAWLEAAIASGEPPKFSYGARMALIVGGSGVLWLCIGLVTAIALS